MGEAIAFSFAVVVAAPAAACLWAGAWHLAAPAELAVAIRQVPILEQALPLAIAHGLARAWGGVEVITGVAVGALLFGRPTFPIQLAVVAWLAGMYLAFVGWLAMLWRRGPGATCGCSAGPEPADGPALMRTALLGVAALLALAILLADVSALAPPQNAVAAFVGVTLAILVWILPAAMRVREVP